MNEASYAQRLCERTARLYRRAHTLGTFLTVLGGSAAVTAAVDRAPSWLAPAGAIVVSFNHSNFSQASAPFDNGGGSGHDGGMEARVARLEASVSHIERDMIEVKADLREIKLDQRSDFRLTWGALIALGMGLAGLMAKGFHWL